MTRLDLSGEVGERVAYSFPPPYHPSIAIHQSCMHLHLSIIPSTFTTVNSIMSAVIRPSLAASRTLREATHRLGESSRSFYAPFAALHSPSILPSRPPQPVLRTRTPHRRQPASSSVRYATTLASSSSATPAPLLSSKPKVRVTPPSLERIKADGFFDDDVQLIAEDQAVMHMSPEAVTVSLQRSGSDMGWLS